MRFPDENPYICEAFDLLTLDARVYYIASYMNEALKNRYYRYCLILHLDTAHASFRRRSGEDIWHRSSAGQRQTIAEFLRIVANEPPDEVFDSEKTVRRKAFSLLDRLRL